MLYSKSTGGFSSTEINGEKIPSDAVKITKEEYQALLEGQSSGMVISSDVDGKPVLTDPAAPTQEQIILRQITDLEATVTARRIRESVLGIDNGWLKSLNDQIADLRAKLTS